MYQLGLVGIGPGRMLGMTVSKALELPLIKAIELMFFEASTAPAIGYLKKK